jgi:hypothetical protein
MTVPSAVYVIWILVLVLAVFVILPVTVLLLQRALNAARNIERYFAEMRDAGIGIANNTQHIVALDSTIQVAGQLLETAEAINEHAATIESALTSRAVTDGHL